MSDSHDAEDLLQEIFCKIHAGIAGLAHPERPGPCLYRIAPNAITDYYRDQAVKAVPIRDPLAQARPDEAASGRAMRERAACLGPMIRALPETVRKPLLLTREEGLTQRAIRRALGLSGAKSRIQRGRRFLRETMLDCCRVEFDRMGNVMDYKPRGSSCRFCP